MIWRIRKHLNHGFAFREERCHTVRLSSLLHPYRRLLIDGG